MNLEEETFLTAYLDGELDPGQRSRVELALLSDPKLCDDLRDLTGVRDVVSGLTRPAAPSDVSAAVVATIRRRRDAGPLARVIGVTAASWSARAVATASAAAALVACASVGLSGRDPDLNGRAALGRAGTGLVRPFVAPDPGQSPNDPGRSSAEAPDANRLAFGNDERRREQERRQVRDLLESPSLRKVLFVTDVVGGDGGRQVADLIDKTPRKALPFGRLTVSHGIVTDPEHPGEASVFVVVMDDNELSHLRARLNEAFPSGVEEAEPRPEVVTELAEVGLVSIFPGNAVANYSIPSENPSPALKSAPSRKAGGLVTIVPEVSGVDPLDVPVSNGALDGFAQDSNGANARLNRRDRAGNSPPLGRSKHEPSVVLVWVEAGRRGR